jgi:hypothetical protein
MMVVLLSAFEAGLDASGRTNCEPKQAGRVCAPRAISCSG